MFWAWGRYLWFISYLGMGEVFIFLDELLKNFAFKYLRGF